MEHLPPATRLTVAVPGVHCRVVTASAAPAQAPNMRPSTPDCSGSSRAAAAAAGLMPQLSHCAKKQQSTSQRSRRCIMLIFPANSMPAQAANVHACWHHTCHRHEAANAVRNVESHTTQLANVERSAGWHADESHTSICSAPTLPQAML
jgi:hypothetical protein